MNRFTAWIVILFSIGLYGFCLYAYFKGHTFGAPFLAIMWTIALLKAVLGVEQDSAKVKAAKAGVGFFAGFKGGKWFT